MTLNIQNLTGIIYGWFLGMLCIMPNMVDAVQNLSHDWLRGIFYIGCLVLIVPFMIERYQSIRLLNHAAFSQRLYKREIIVAMLIVLTRLISSMLIISVLIGGYHLYWVYQNYSTFSRKAVQNK